MTGSASGTTSTPVMPDASRSRATLVATWRALSTEQRAAGIGALLLAVSTLGPFSWVEAAILVVAFGVLLLLKKRADGAAFHLPFGDGTIIAAAGLWAAVLVLVRVFDRSLGQALLALLCAAIVVIAGLAERANRPPDDVATEPLGERGGARSASDRSRDVTEPVEPDWHDLPTERTSGRPDSPAPDQAQTQRLRE